MMNILNILTVQKVYASSLGASLNSSLSDVTNNLVDSQGNLSLKTITQVAIPLGVICVVLLLVYGGYILMTSQGNPDKLQEGKQIITNAIIGFVIVLLCTAILLIISNSLGLNIYG